MWETHESVFVSIQLPDNVPDTAYDVPHHSVYYLHEFT